MQKERAITCRRSDTGPSEQCVLATATYTFIAEVRSAHHFLSLAVFFPHLTASVFNLHFSSLAVIFCISSLASTSNGGATTMSNGGATAITCRWSDSDYTSLYVTWRSGSDYMPFSAISPAPTVLVTFSACSRPRPLARFAATTSHRLACLRLQLALLLLRYQRASFFIFCCTFLYLIFCVKFKMPFE